MLHSYVAEALLRQGVGNADKDDQRTNETLLVSLLSELTEVTNKGALSGQRDALNTGYR